MIPQNTKEPRTVFKTPSLTPLASTAYPTTMASAITPRKGPVFRSSSYDLQRQPIRPFSRGDRAGHRGPICRRCQGRQGWRLVHSPRLFSVLRDHLPVLLREEPRHSLQNHHSASQTGVGHTFKKAGKSGIVPYRPFRVLQTTGNAAAGPGAIAFVFV